MRFPGSCSSRIERPRTDMGTKAMSVSEFTLHKLLLLSFEGLGRGRDFLRVEGQAESLCKSRPICERRFCVCQKISEGAKNGQGQPVCSRPDSTRKSARLAGVGQEQAKYWMVVPPLIK